MTPLRLVAQEILSCFPGNIENMKKQEIGRGYSPYKSCNEGQVKKAASAGGMCEQVWDFYDLSLMVYRRQCFQVM